MVFPGVMLTGTRKWFSLYFLLSSFTSNIAKSVVGSEAGGAKSLRELSYKTRVSNLSRQSFSSRWYSSSDSPSSRCVCHMTQVSPFFISSISHFKTIMTHMPVSSLGHPCKTNRKRGVPFNFPLLTQFHTRQLSQYSEYATSLIIFYKDDSL